MEQSNDITNKTTENNELNIIISSFLKSTGVNVFLDEIFHTKKQALNAAAAFNEDNNLLIIKEKIINNHNLTHNSFIELFELYKKTMKNFKNPKTKNHVDHILQGIFDDHKIFIKNHTKDFNKFKIIKIEHNFKNSFKEYENKLNIIIENIINKLAISVINESADEISYDEFQSLNKTFYNKASYEIIAKTSVLEPYCKRLNAFIKQFEAEYIKELDILSQSIKNSDIKTETIKVQNYIKAVKDTYDKLLREYNYLDHIFSFKESTSLSLTPISIKPSADIMFFKQIVAKNISNNIKNFTSCKKCIYEYNKIITDTSLLIDTMINRIEYLEFVNNNKNPIINGINETISIKIETLKEEKIVFINDVANLILNTDFNVTFNERDINGLAAGVLSFYINNGNLKTFNEKYDILLHNQYNDYHEKQKQFIQNKIIHFYKNVLLYELASMEEMFYYSLGKLIENDNEKDYITHIRTVLEDIKLTLKKHDIDMIIPQINDDFDGKLHNIIIAEIKDGVKKGKIVNTISPGYKYMDKPLIRANIIVTK